MVPMNTISIATEMRTKGEYIGLPVYVLVEPDGDNTEAERILLPITQVTVAEATEHLPKRIELIAES